MKRPVQMIALTCFMLATFGVNVAHFALVPLGLALMVLAELI